MSLLPQYLLPLSAVTLGRFIIDRDDPQQDYHDPQPAISPKSSSEVQLNYSSSSSSEKDARKASKLTNLLSTNFSERLNAQIKVTSPQAKTYYLHNVGQYFREAVTLEATQKWIIDRIDDGDDEIYVVTAFHTLLDAQVVERSGKSSDVGGGVEIPVSTILAASGVIVPMAETLDSRIEGSKGYKSSEQRRFKAPGEQIFAVQYRKMKFRWFASKDIEHMVFDKKPFWKRYDSRKLRGSKDLKDAIEVELEDQDDEEDLQGNWFGGPDEKSD